MGFLHPTSVNASASSSLGGKYTPSCTLWASEKEDLQALMVGSSSVRYVFPCRCCMGISAIRLYGENSFEVVGIGPSPDWNSHLPCIATHRASYSFSIVG